eukprot:symbB.v1.2.022654.t1/scaffold2027.1/size138498/2
MSQEDRSDVANLDLVEARVHLAAAQYHNSLANGKLIPHPPTAPRARPASAGAQRPARPWSAQSAHSCPSGSQVRRAEFLEAQRMDSATDALAGTALAFGDVDGTVDGIRNPKGKHRFDV